MFILIVVGKVVFKEYNFLFAAFNSVGKIKSFVKVFGYKYFLLRKACG